MKTIRLLHPPLAVGMNWGEDVKRSALLLFCLLARLVSALAQNPVPLVNQPLVPADAVPGGAAFTLTLKGTGFVSGATVDWNGADPNQIKLSFAAADGMRIDAASGDLVLSLGNGEVRLHKPAIYQPAVAAGLARHLPPQARISLTHRKSPVRISRWTPPAGEADEAYNLLLGSTENPFPAMGG